MTYFNGQNLVTYLEGKVDRKKYDFTKADDFRLGDCLLIAIVAIDDTTIQTHLGFTMTSIGGLQLRYSRLPILCRYG